ncbi:MAG: protein-glutamate O-methyltransferase CheR [Candidatus Devosia phytovorans]|uniref:protein-glutamate O-methyltransferase n=1 Tax=Candidatus Devosia phytovorans TaxID=3121372 RepID=A0AAJ5VZ38_9HYPH|nr:protein-glutamate O-methyltransferase CheR [Devosia sp.]WEK06850.1 MAG: protein-glutamate O-methyltransferase CheR [Devosia sp.]
MLARAKALAPLSSVDFARLCDLLYTHTGMQFDEAKRYYLDRRVADRMVQTGTETFAEYLSQLRTRPEEIQHLINSVTVNETYFYREEHQLACLSKSILPEVALTKKPGDRIRIWSMPCSSGEEPYSIAIWLLENWHLVDAYNVEIVGSDIDTDVIEQARGARYAPRALARLPEAIVNGYFSATEDGQRQLIADLRESVSFSRVNMMDEASVSAMGTFDVIFCRNLLIYFDDAARERGIQSLFDILRPGGFICLGHSETMSRISDRFLTRRFEDAIVYQRPR